MMAARVDHLAVVLRPMHLSDVPQVSAIDRLCFTTPWPARSYRYELTQSRNSKMFVLSLPKQECAQSERNLRALLDHLRSGSPDAGTVVGYSGLWFAADEVHISTIGVHPDWRGLRLGELLLFAMLRQAVRMGARVTTLELRVSNQVALNLYQKYGFEVIDCRKGYYRDNREDAWVMSVDLSAVDYIERLRGLGAALYGQLDVLDEWD